MLLEYHLLNKNIFVRECLPEELFMFISYPLTGGDFPNSINPKGAFKIDGEERNKVILEEYRKNK